MGLSSEDIMRDVYSPTLHLLHTDAVFSGSITIGAVKIEDGTGTDVAGVMPANTAHAATEPVLLTQAIDASGKVAPAGDAVGNAPFTKLTNGTNTATVNAAGELAVSLSSDIEIGGVEIKNGTDDTRATVKTDGTNNALVVFQNYPTAIYNNVVNVTTAGTRVALAASTAIKSVVIKAKVGNTNNIYVGNSTVASTNGLILSNGESVAIDIDNLSKVYIDSDTNGEGVTYLAS